jgi:hypothetical protein
LPFCTVRGKLDYANKNGGDATAVGEGGMAVKFGNHILEEET